MSTKRIFVWKNLLGRRFSKKTFLLTFCPVSGSFCLTQPAIVLTIRRL